MAREDQSPRNWRQDNDETAEALTDASREQLPVSGEAFSEDSTAKLRREDLSKLSAYQVETASEGFRDGGRSNQRLFNRASNDVDLYQINEAENGLKYSTDYYAALDGQDRSTKPSEATETNPLGYSDDLSYFDESRAYEDARIESAASYEPHVEELRQLREIRENPYFSDEQKAAMSARVRRDFALSRSKSLAKKKVQPASHDEDGENEGGFEFGHPYDTARIYYEEQEDKRQAMPRPVIFIFSLLFMLFFILSVAISSIFFYSSRPGARSAARQLNIRELSITERDVLGQGTPLSQVIYQRIPDYIRVNINGGEAGFVNFLENHGLRNFIGDNLYLIAGDALSGENRWVEESPNLIRQYFESSYDDFTALVSGNYYPGDYQWFLQQFYIASWVGSGWKSLVNLDGEPGLYLSLFYRFRYYALALACLLCVLSLTLLRRSYRGQVRNYYSKLGHIFFILGLIFFIATTLPIKFFIHSFGMPPLVAESLKSILQAHLRYFGWFLGIVGLALTVYAFVKRSVQQQRRKS
ncbi:MAG: hypothetical protein Q4P72_01905 [Eubacteriales bacterium]|nr:hypothetical protein [Eubacteriales bacterium]